ncbi:SDR family NAD(P)-dependent oxidoreductase [Acuticoccus mangrovi]|uniref:SDR family NAD(P)-dependent oxidoreductase n=1 Tax=Acuticoccus mangrovi TaxID=2796142 RepID=A0A934MGQ4_9HYPH|nr:SDR family NAD(P)-dependent oxidoreductase [Acuticoccus mangrovi]MBJ3775241.1 SDR family NAD(P)-dependent oxidoreductase [Acuticoccus mangrovi]
MAVAAEPPADDAAPPKERPPLVIVTGASSGIGQAIAVRLARPGLHLGLVGRNAEGLDRAAAAVEARGGRAISSRIDLATHAFEHWVEHVAERFTVVGLYANAGLSAGPATPRELESAADTERLVATNLVGTIACVRAVVGAMRAAEKRPDTARRIGIVSSVSGLLPTPDLAVYSATKAGLVAYAHALRPRLKRDAITVSVICPGFITSPMSARHKGAKPFEVSADAAARRIIGAVEAGRRTTIFPFPFAAMAYLAPLAPGALIDALVPSFDAHIEPDPRVEPRFAARPLADKD